LPGPRQDYQPLTNNLGLDYRFLLPLSDSPGVWLPDMRRFFMAIENTRDRHAKNLPAARSLEAANYDFRQVKPATLPNPHSAIYSPPQQCCKTLLHNVWQDYTLPHMEMTAQL